MKTLLLSDLHSNIAALEAVWNKEHDADRVLCAGDIVDYGPHPAECVDWMIAHDATVVRGNHDESVVGAFRHPTDDEIVPWRVHNARKLSERHGGCLPNLPVACVVEIDGIEYGMTHAYQNYEIIRSLEGFRSFCDSRFGRTIHRIIFGHTHRREVHYLADDTLRMNPGSSSYRRQDDPDQRAHYAVIQDGQISLRAATYPVEPLYEYARQARVVDSDRNYALYFWGPRPWAEKRAR